MVKGYVRGGLCPPLCLFKELLVVFIFGAQQRGEKKSPLKKEARLFRDAGKAPVVQGVRPSVTKTGSANTFNDRGFFFSGIFCFGDKFG